MKVLQKVFLSTLTMRASNNTLHDILDPLCKKHYICILTPKNCKKNVKTNSTLLSYALVTQFCWVITVTIIIYLSRYPLKIFKFIYCVYTCMHPYTYVSIREHLQGLFCLSTMWVQVKPTIRLGCNGLHHSLSHLVGPP